MAPTRQALHVSIESSPYNQNRLQLSPDSDSPSSRASDSTSPTSGSSESIITSALCMFDFQSNDPVHLPFRKNEILDIVKQEDTGWWAAMRQGGDMIGWVPQAFLQPLSEEMTDRLRNVREELRVYEYEAEQLYNSAPIARAIPLYDPDPFPSPLYGSYQDSRRRPYPPSPATPMPQPPLNRPTPPTPTDNEIVPQRYRSESAPSSSRPIRRPGRLATLSEYGRDSPVELSSSPDKKRLPKVTRMTGSDDARIFHDALQAQTKGPWFLRPKHWDKLIFDAEGLVRSGTIDALLEKLTSDTLTKDPIKAAQETAYRNVFLTTFRTFISADALFDKLVDIYRMEYPSNVTNSEFEEWKEKCYLPTQRLVLTIFTIWLEDHRLLEEEPHIAQRLTDFLVLITAPPPLALNAKLIVQTIERLTFAQPAPIASSLSPQKRRKSKPHKGDLLRLDPADIAEQLALLEFSLYSKITTQECLRYAKIQSGKPVANLVAFCATHDKLAAWVQSTVLSNEALGRRADTVDFWIRVAEKCRNLNNFSSMVAVINALSSTVLTRLHLTWAHVGRKSNLDALLKYNDPSGGFSAYRALQLNAEGSCVPFIGMYLTDIVHIQDQFSEEDGRISFVRCQRWYDVVAIMLKSQSRPYSIAENDSTSTFINNHLRTMAAGSKDQARFWARSQEVQQLELAHADIRRGLEAAGF
ncbi:ras guanine nucleotide exchange factor domain-containing protein [Mycena floridula]|nr:ras guanine nucleotide exchange factor domain-containing protein [Mycena floridula]